MLSAPRVLWLSVVWSCLSIISPPVHADPPAISIRDTRHQGWKTLETDRVRLHYSGDRTAAANSLTICEDRIRELRKKWIADSGDSAWSCPCDVYLYPDARSFERGSFAPARMWGVTELEIGEGVVWMRRLHVRTDDRDKLDSVLVHELTHVVLAEYFANHKIPCWADEGIAVCSEPARRRRDLHSVFQTEARMKRLIPLSQLTSLQAPPADDYRGKLFYGQSSALIEYLLTHHKWSEARVLTFVEQCGNRGWDQSVRQAFPGQSPARLEADWRDWALKSATTALMADEDASPAAALAETKG